MNIAHFALVHGATIGDKVFVFTKAQIISSEIGEGSYIYASAIFMGVTVEANKYVPPGACILTQKQADALDDVPEERKKFYNVILEHNLKHPKEWVKYR